VLLPSSQKSRSRAQNPSGSPEGEPATSESWKHNELRVDWGDGGGLGSPKIELSSWTLSHLESLTHRDHVFDNLAYRCQGHSQSLVPIVPTLPAASLLCVHTMEWKIPDHFATVDGFSWLLGFGAARRPDPVCRKAKVEI
jgi:hypothetical protein